MIQDIENKSKEELLEIVKIQQEEYQSLMKAKANEIISDFESVDHFESPHVIYLMAKDIDRLNEDRQKRDLEMKASGIYEVMKQVSKSYAVSEPITQWEQGANCILARAIKAARKIEKQVQEIGK